MLIVPVLVLSIAAQAPPVQTPRSPAMPRDAPRPREGTGVIYGRITSVDTGQPLRRAFVSLTGGPSDGAAAGTATISGARSGGAGGPRAVATNADGRFEFRGLAAGTYRLRATAGAYRGHYLAIAFGARSSMDGGQPIELGDGQRFQADIALPRGGAIVGRVVDDFGEPVSRIMVFPSRVMPGGSIQRTGGGFNQTDDLGRFRLYGLEPGEYVVAAEARGMGGPPIEGVSEGFVITYFPSALSEREASRVRVAGANDSADVEIMLVRTRTFQITGTVMDSQGRVVMRPNAMLVRSGGSGFSTSGMFSSDPSGKITIRDVVPGEYRLVVRPRSMGPQAEQPPAQGQPRPEHALVALSVSADIEDLVVVTQPGVTVSGQVVFAEGAPPAAPSGMRVTVQPADRMNMVMMGTPPSAAVGSNLQFTLTDVFGPQMIRLSGLPPEHALKAVLLGATDITDVPVEFKSEQGRQLQVVVTSRASVLDGTVTDERGEPASEFMVLAIPEDKSSWKMGSSRLRMTGAAKTGRFELKGLLAGRYYVVAFPRGRMFLTPDTSADAFEPLIKDATTVVIGEDDRRTIDLRMAKTLPGR